MSSASPPDSPRRNMHTRISRDLRERARVVGKAFGLSLNSMVRASLLVAAKRDAHPFGRGNHPKGMDLVDVCVWVSDAEKDALKRTANARDTSPARYIEDCLEAYLETLVALHAPSGREPSALSA